VKIFSNGSGGSGKASSNVCIASLYYDDYNAMTHFSDFAGCLTGYMVDYSVCKSFYFRKSSDLALNKIYIRCFDANGNTINFNDTTYLVTDYIKSQTKFRYVANYSFNVMSNANIKEVSFTVVDSVKKIFIGAQMGQGTIELYSALSDVPKILNPNENVVSFVPNSTINAEVGDRVFCTSVNKPIFIKALDANGVPTWVDGAGNTIQ
jgi:hypothetical protein